MQIKINTVGVDAQSSVSVLQFNSFITSGDKDTKKNRVDTGNTSNIGDNITNSSARSSRQDDQDHFGSSIDNDKSRISYNKSNCFDSGDTYSNLNNYYDIENEKSWNEKEIEIRNQNRNKIENTVNKEKEKTSGSGEINRIETDSLFTESESGSVRNIPKKRISPMIALLQSLLRIEENSVAEDENSLPSPTLSSQTRSQSQMPSQYLPRSQHNSVAQYHPFSSFPFQPLSPSNAPPFALFSSITVSLQLPGSRASYDGFSGASQISQSSLPHPRPPPLSLPIPSSPPLQI